LTDFQRNSILEAKNRVSDNYKLIILNRNIQELGSVEADFNQDKVSELLKKYEVKSIKADDVIALFSSTLSKKFTNPEPAYKLETYSLFS
jgi:histone acetyltransferase (RNA polymerase elongator complex component)